ncbi:MAG: hypothetical protein HYR63_28560 [Proteobacteria bacterium]|nr:hypothetical protein [Pseudomonadota bacterium]MBI3498375.1 hypothetical protein [Pseudomonadota bacterium]
MIRHPILGSVDPNHVIMTWHTGVRRRFQANAGRLEYLTVLPRGMAPFLQIAESTSTSTEYLELFLEEIFRETAQSKEPVPAVVELHWLGNRYMELYVGRRARSRLEAPMAGTWLILSNLDMSDRDGGIALVHRVVDTVNRMSEGRGLLLDLSRVLPDRGPLIRLG